MTSFFTFLLGLLGFTVPNVDQNNVAEPVYKNSIQQQSIEKDMSTPDKAKDDTDIYRFNNGHSEIG